MAEDLVGRAEEVHGHKVAVASGRRAEMSDRRGGRQRTSSARPSGKARTVEDLEDGGVEEGARERALGPRSSARRRWRSKREERRRRRARRRWRGKREEGRRRWRAASGYAGG